MDCRKQRAANALRSRHRHRPQTPSTLYAGTGGAGVFKSTDGGATWTSINASWLSNAFVLALAVDPELPATIYVGSAGAQILKSTDGGSTWSGVGPLMETKVLAIDRKSPPRSMRARMVRFPRPLTAEPPGPELP